MKEIIIKIKKLLQNKIVIFFLVSALNTLFGYSLLATLILIGLHYSVAGGVALVIGVLFNFKTIGGLVFKNKNNKVIFKFFGVYGINYILSIGLITLLERSGIDSSISSKLFQITNMKIFVNPRVDACIGAAILVVPIGFFSFALNHYFVFNKPKTSNLSNAE